MVSTQNYMRDRAGKFALLVGIAIVIHLLYQMIVIPQAEAWTATQVELVRKNPGYRPTRSFFTIIKEREPQVTIIISLWAAVTIRQQRTLIYLLALGVCLGAIGRIISMMKVGVPEPPALWFGYAASELILPLIIVVAHYATTRRSA